MSRMSLEELHPDNQERSSDYYLGSSDATRYAMDLVAEVFKDDPRAGPVGELLWELFASCEDRRRTFFTHHMGIKFPSAKAALERRD